MNRVAADTLSCPDSAAAADPSVVFAMVTPATLGAMHALEQQVQLEPWSLRQFQDSLLAQHDAWLMYRTEAAEPSGAEPLGYAVMSRLLDEAELLTIGIQPALQGRGWGQRLLEFVCQQARIRGMARLLLEVRVSNLAAQALYQRCGFVVCGRRQSYYRTASGREDALLMHCLL